MPRLTQTAATLLLAGALIPGAIAPMALAQVYKVTDEDNGVVFTDRPEPGRGRTVEEVEIRESNRVGPPPEIPRAEPAEAPRDEPAAEPTVTITSPANESTIAMGPGNFTVSARTEPPLGRGEDLLLMMDGQPVGAGQTGASWAIEGAMRGPHDLVVQRRSAAGRSLATSEPVRVYVLRPSIR